MAPGDERLELDADRMRALGHRVVDMIVDHLARLGEKSTGRILPRGELEAWLRQPPPEEGTDPDAVLDTLERQVLSGILHVNHPRFFAFVPLPGNYISVLADALAAGFAVFSGTWMAGSGPAEVELVAVDWLREICGLPRGARGLFLSGGSMANLTALAAARHARLGSEWADAVVYGSDQLHASVDRALAVLGFSPGRLRKIATDPDFRISLPALRSAVAEDRRAGLRPFCVVANAGSTNTGAVDPLEEIADLCTEANLWLHADGAYGAPAVLTEKGRTLLRGLDRVDSLTLDPHKWLFQPLEMGCLILREGRLLREAFEVRPEYMKDTERGEEEVNFCDYGIQLTRSFRALKLWMSFKVFGLGAFRRAVEHGLQLAELAGRLVDQSPSWAPVTPPMLGVLTFRWAGNFAGPDAADAFHHRLSARMIRSGFAVVTTTRLAGRTVLRLCTNNPRTTAEDVRRTFRKLEETAREI
jgi:glutamate/tyrosine decarboxylase-like PLP-dependent enzyme